MHRNKLIWSFVAAPISVGLIVEVFVAKMACGGAYSSTFLKVSIFNSIISRMASMTKSALPLLPATLLYRLNFVEQGLVVHL